MLYGANVISVGVQKFRLQNGYWIAWFPFVEPLLSKKGLNEVEEACQDFINS